MIVRIVVDSEVLGRVEDLVWAQSERAGDDYDPRSGSDVVAAVEREKATAVRAAGLVVDRLSDRLGIGEREAQA